MKQLLIGIAIGAMVVLTIWRWQSFSLHFEVERRLENYVAENDSAIVVYSMRLLSEKPDIWDVGFRNKYGIQLQEYVVEKDTIFPYPHNKLRDALKAWGLE